MTEVEIPIFTGDLVFDPASARSCGAILQKKIFHAREAQNILHRRLQAGEREMKRVLLREFARANHHRKTSAVDERNVAEINRQRAVRL